MENTYWNNNGKLQKEYERLHDKYVPPFGAADTLIGEAIRASSRIYHDAYNNGFGNNTSGAWKFLHKYIRPLIKDENFEAALDHLKERVNHSWEEFIPNLTEVALETLADSVVQFCIDNESDPMPSPCDMFDLQEKDWQEAPEYSYH